MIFRRKTPAQPAAPHTDLFALSPEALLKTPALADFIKQLASLVSVTKPIFDEFYKAPLAQLAALVQQLPAVTAGRFHTRNGFLQLTLERTLMVLKYRRGLMLPIGGSPETQYREHDIWTYALYTASLLRDVWQLGIWFSVQHGVPQGQLHAWHPLTGPLAPALRYQFTVHTKADHALKPTLNTLLCRQVLSDPAFKWLLSVPAVFAEWLIAITHGTEPSCIKKIVDDAHAQVAADPMATPILALPTPPIRLLTGPLAQPLSSATASPVSVAEQFMAWLQQSLAAQQLRINEPDADLIQTELGSLIIVPKIIDAFIKEHAFQNTPITLVQFTAGIASADYLIQHEEGSSFFHRYYLGDWKNRQVLEGLLIKTDVLFQGITPPLIHPDYHVDFDL